MHSRSTIQPFGFERVFFHPAEAPLSSSDAEDEAPAPATPAELREQVEDLEARIARMQTDHFAELGRVRAEGFEAGLTQARSERGEALLAATDALHAALDAIGEHFDAVARTMVSEAGAVALQAAEMLAGHAIDMAPARAIDEALDRVLEQVARGTPLVVRAHPDMHNDLAALIEAHEAKAGRPLAISVIEDATVPVADARIEWYAGGLNVDAEARRAAVMAELAGVLGRAGR